VEGGLRSGREWPQKDVSSSVAAKVGVGVWEGEAGCVGEDGIGSVIGGNGREEHCSIMQRNVRRKEVEVDGNRWSEWEWVKGRTRCRWKGCMELI
jgi:hypothetical protein